MIMDEYGTRAISVLDARRGHDGLYEISRGGKVMDVIGIGMFSQIKNKVSEALAANGLPDVRYDIVRHGTTSDGGSIELTFPGEILKNGVAPSIKFFNTQLPVGYPFVTMSIDGMNPAQVVRIVSALVDDAMDYSTIGVIIMNTAIRRAEDDIRGVTTSDWMRAAFADAESIGLTNITTPKMIKNNSTIMVYSRSLNKCISITASPKDNPKFFACRGYSVLYVYTGWEDRPHPLVNYQKSKTEFPYDNGWGYKKVLKYLEGYINKRINK